MVAFAGTASAVCAAILRFREGRLVDKREFLFHDTQDLLRKFKGDRLADTAGRARDDGDLSFE